MRIFICSEVQDQKRSAFVQKVMPELPEVEAARKVLDENCVGRVIERVIVPVDEKVIEGISSIELASSLEGRKIIAVKRKGKHLWLELDERPWPILHLGISEYNLVLCRAKLNVFFL